MTEIRREQIEDDILFYKKVMDRFRDAPVVFDEAHARWAILVDKLGQLNLDQLDGDTLIKSENSPESLSGFLTIQMEKLSRHHQVRLYKYFRDEWGKDKGKNSRTRICITKVWPKVDELDGTYISVLVNAPIEIVEGIYRDLYLKDLIVR